MSEDTELMRFEGESEISTREIKAKTLWEGSQKTNTLIRGFEVRSDEPITDFGSNEHPAPAEIFLGSIGACLTSGYAMAAYAQRLRLHAISASLTGKLEWKDGVRKVTRVDINVKVTAQTNRPDKLERCFDIAKKRCLILNSIDCEKNIELKIKISEE